MATTVEAITTEKRCSTRFSTYSMAPTLAPSIAPSRLSHVSTSSSSTDTPYSKDPSSSAAKASPMAADMKSLQTGFARMDDPNLQRQRYEASETKREEISKLALGAKIDKALARRMTGQDATFSVKVVKKVEVQQQQDHQFQPVQQEPFIYDENSIGIAH